MSKEFVNAMFDSFNQTQTTNGAKAFKSTKSYVLDLFALGGASRNLDENKIRNMVTYAIGEHLELAVRTIFYLGDVRGGQRARRFFQIAMKELVRIEPKRMEKVLHLIPEYTRWDMLYTFEGTSLEAKAFAVLAKEVADSTIQNRPSLVFKWLKSIGTSSKESVRLGRLTAKYFGLTEKDYRKLLVRGRQKLNLVESNMSQNKWGKINFEHVPSLASLKYKKAFKKHNLVRYNKFLDAVMTGEAKMNMAVEFPHNIVAKYRHNSNSYGWNRRALSLDGTLEAAWKSLPNYMEGKTGSMFVMADVSGSMDSTLDSKTSVTAMDVSIALAIYTSEKMSGPFKNTFMTFSDSPAFVTLPDKATLQTKIEITEAANWTSNTDIDKAMRKILDVAVTNRVKADQMPSMLAIVSDMQFDGCAKISNLDTWRKEFNDQGYELPNIVFWCVNAYENVATTMNQKGVVLISGYSPSILEEFFGMNISTPFDLMMKVVMKERYNVVAKAFML